MGDGLRDRMPSLPPKCEDVMSIVCDLFVFRLVFLENFADFRLFDGLMFCRESIDEDFVIFVGMDESETVEVGMD